MGYIAENTLPSIKKAIDLGANGVEIDIFRCASGELVVFHDKTLEKLRDLEILIKTQPKINSGVVLKDFLVNFCNLHSNASLKA